MAVTETSESAQAPPAGADIPAAVDRLRATYESGKTRDLDWREAQLDGVIHFLEDHSDALLAAMKSDLGRHEVEAWGADVGPSLTEARYIKKRFRKWASPRSVKVSLIARPGKGHIVPEPLGVALIISPWNYPVNLLLEPMVAAFAAGNTVVAKPSELSPETSNLIASALPAYLDEDAFAIFEGGPEVSTELLEQRFDHIFFTGSTHVGKIVMAAAAKNLTPVTLELGGKSPVIVTEDADLETAANRIAWGKLLNAGQTCIAPDYVLVTEPNRDRLIDLIVDAWGRFYGPNPQKSADLGRIVSDRHLQRLVGLLTDQTVAHGGDHDAASRYMAPTIVVDPDLQSPLMTEEIFGPILPVVTVDSVDDAIRFVNGRPKPLALYPFSKDDDTIEEILRRTSSGGVCVNHTLFHFSPHELPFGGVGSSGMGRYHGQSGFDGFSNPKGVLRKPTKVETSLIYPPYGKFKTRLLRRLT